MIYSILSQRSPGRHPPRKRTYLGDAAPHQIHPAAWWIQCLLVAGWQRPRARCASCSLPYAFLNHEYAACLLTYHEGFGHQEECRRYEEKITTHGGVELFIGGTGDIFPTAHHGCIMGAITGTITGTMYHGLENLIRHVLGPLVISWAVREAARRLLAQL